MKKQFGLYGDIIKRVLDIILSGLAFIILSPFIGIIALLVRTKLGSPIVFKQVRPGKNERLFFLYKFRSMTNDVDETGMLLPDEQRLTKFGNFLRSSSIDELLELFNIIKGDMSIVGPRPLSIYYLPHYSGDTRRRHEVRPGLTGLAQVSGRNNLDWEQRFAYDINYVDNVSFALDLRIILRTVLKVMKSADISVRGTTEIRDFGPYSTIKEEGGVTVPCNNMTYREIGSYFWLENVPKESNVTSNLDWLPNMTDTAYTISGRAAIDIAIRDLLANRLVREVYVPSYCCISMLQPFTDHGIGIKFYSVSYENGRFNYTFEKNNSCDLILTMSYFGLETTTERVFIRDMHERGAIVIEDITHSLLRNDSCSDYCDYAIASLRKWFPIPAGGWVGKRSGMLMQKPNIESDNAVAGKIEGMKEKYAYLSGTAKDKENFLVLQSKFDTDLIHLDRLLKIDNTSMTILSQTDCVYVAEKRRANARIMMDGLKDLDGTILSLPHIDMDGDVPLFLPVFLGNEDRDSLRAYLIGQGIYCPVHWPEVMGAPRGIRENELSLICDQRYSICDMDSIVFYIHKWACERLED